MKRIKTWEINPPTHKPKSSLVAQTVKGLPAVQETRVWYLAWEDPLEKGMAIHSSILAWKIPWMEESGWPQTMRSQRVNTTERLTHTHTHVNPRLEIQRTPNMINPKKSMPRHIIVKLWKTKAWSKNLESNHINDTLPTREQQCIYLWMSHEKLWRPERSKATFLKCWTNCLIIQISAK